MEKLEVVLTLDKFADLKELRVGKFAEDGLLEDRFDEEPPRAASRLANEDFLELKPNSVGSFKSWISMVLFLII